MSLADGNPYTKTATGTTPQELQQVEARKMLKPSFFLYFSAQIQSIVDFFFIQMFSFVSTCIVK